MTEGLRFRVSGKDVFDSMISQAEAKEQRAIREKEEHEAYQQAIALLPKRKEDCSDLPKIAEKCVGEHWLREAQKLRRCAKFVDITETFLLTKREIDCLLQMDEYGHYNDYAEAETTGTTW